ncbi:MAG: hypothetical protein UT48_C0015G0009 [Parcubacteria group bacterium GW2011_GWE2_39_37]|uniref:Uncharacterized protein n=1 Tax=Candidatus Falkowbacteria bacterium GW2011_GWF2_39_8 TaxID=1618642 RepID=A0A0G0Q4E2_9BACT|nr:MAG: hypothetical protein UT48_C0015G0009 [Parcubacteria group bacterium GW2011_GWE2_39_37]KKR32231.1 MAG: hypothetical protein UT64_C0039G0010 [Candidatus Falkowbacteria bacterium GW2011_GWF2_39_8]
MEVNQNRPAQGGLKKAFKIFGAVLVVLALMFVVVFAYNYWRISTGRLIKWEGQYYTKDQIKQKYGEQVYDVPAKNTPEEVYTKFREALLKNDIEGALGVIREEKRDGYREAFKDEVKFDKWVKTLPKKITKDNEMGNFAYYDIDYGTENKNSVDFVKNKEGYWQIDGI